MPKPNSEPFIILLAAGLSTRSGAEHKLSRASGSTNLLTQQLNVLNDLPEHRKCVVVSERTREFIQDHQRIQQVLNRDSAQGMLSSIQAAIKVAPEASGFIISLADLTELKPHHYRTIIEGAASTHHLKLIAPFYEGQRGHPVFIPALYANEILELKPTDKGLKFLWQKYPFHDIEVSDSAYIKDRDE